MKKQIALKPTPRQALRRLLLFAALVLVFCFYQSAYAALGDFLFKWGSYGSGNGQFNYPSGVAVDSAGNVYVTDNENHRRRSSQTDSGVS